MPGPFRLIVVRRDHQYLLRHILGAGKRWPPGTAVMVDCRSGDRRTRIKQMMLERRQGQRRAEPDMMWLTHGFIVVKTERIPRQAVLL